MRQSYKEKLLDPRWQKLRLEILQRDNWTCQGCKATDKTLHVHHIAYEDGEPWDTDTELLITLCFECHETEGMDHKVALRGLLSILSMVGVKLSGDLSTLSAAIDDAWCKNASGDGATAVADGARKYFSERPRATNA